MVVAAILKNPKPEVVGRAHTCRMILYYLRSICTNFGALDQRVTKILLSHWTSSIYRV